MWVSHLSGTHPAISGGGPVRRRSYGLILLLFFTVPAAAGPLPGNPPDAQPQMHLGVASCAGSNCHGATQPVAGARILQNEYLTWQRLDPHARAYLVLLGDRSQAIARRLGIADPANASACLGCHSDHVAPALQGARFSLSDGVGCEACHGGAEHWINDHAVAHRSHAANVAEGMYPTDDPVARTRLCLACHYGGGTDRQMNHAIMAAGHPPLLFEVVTFTAIEPAHYRVDVSYRQRKIYVGPADTWAQGQAVFSLRLVRTLAAESTGKSTRDFYAYECYGCHQPLRPNDPLAVDTGAKPGQLRFYHAPLTMLALVLDTAQAPMAADWQRQLAAFSDRAEPDPVLLKTMTDTANQAVAYLQSHPLGEAAQRQLIRRLAEEGTTATYGSRSQAEQTVMALTDLYQDARERGRDKAFGTGFPAALDGAYRSLHTLSDFDAASYRNNMQKILDAVPDK